MNDREEIERIYRGLRAARNAQPAEPEPEVDTQRIMDAACKRAWTRRLDVRPLIAADMARYWARKLFERLKKDSSPTGIDGINPNQ